jgi:lipopolysaccharide cholinephosphotransferase
MCKKWLNYNVNAFKGNLIHVGKPQHQGIFDVYILIVLLEVGVLKQDIYKNMRQCSLREAQLVMLQILKEVHKICEKHEIQYFLTGGTLLGAIRHKGFIPWDDDLDIALLRSDYEKFIRIAEVELPREYFLQTFATDPHYDLYHIPVKVRYNNSIFIEEKEERKKYHRGIYIDVFPIDRAPQSDAKVKIQGCIKKTLLVMKLNPSKKDAYSLKFFGRSALQLIGKGISYRLIRKILYSTKGWNEKSERPMYIYGVDLLWNHTLREKDLFPLKKVPFEDGEFWVPHSSDKILTDMYGNFMELPPEEKRASHAKFIGLKR